MASSKQLRLPSLRRVTARSPSHFSFKHVKRGKFESVVTDVVSGDDSLDPAENSADWAGESTVPIEQPEHAEELPSLHSIKQHSTVYAWESIRGKLLQCAVEGHSMVKEEKCSKCPSTAITRCLHGLWALCVFLPRVL